MTPEMQPVCRLDVYHVLYAHTAALRVNKPFVPQSGTQTGTKTKRGHIFSFPKAENKLFTIQHFHQAESPSLKYRLEQMLL